MNLYIVGATGLVGRKLIEILNDSSLEFEEMCLFSSKRSAGERIKYKDKYLVVKSEIDEIKPKNGVVILCVDKSVSKVLVPDLLAKDLYVIDCSTEFRKCDEIPLIAVGVNEEKIQDSKLICNPNCVVMQIILILDILKKTYGLNKIDVVSFQSVSGSGKKGIEDLKSKNSLFYPYNINRTCIPIVGEILDNNYSSEEDKVRYEIRKMLDLKDLKVSATCVRVPVEFCHGISLSVELNNDFKEKEIIELLSNNPSLIYKEIPNGEEAIDNDFVYFGRVRKDLDNPKIVHMYVVGDNLRRGAASNAYWILKTILSNKKREYK